MKKRERPNVDEHRHVIKSQELEPGDVMSTHDGNMLVVGVVIEEQRVTHYNNVVNIVVTCINKSQITTRYFRTGEGVIVMKKKR